MEKWKFDKSIAPIFEEHIRKSVPLYEEIHQFISKVVNSFEKESLTICDIGTATGKAIRTIYENCKNKRIEFTAIDNSKDMLEAAREECRNIPNVEFICDSVSNLELKKHDCIISIYTMQFLPLDKRERVYRQIYDSLNAGGVFLLCEKIRHENERINAINTQLHEAFKKKMGFTQREIQEKKESLLEVMWCNTPQEIESLLPKQAKKEVIMKHLNFVGYLISK